VVSIPWQKNYEEEPPVLIGGRPCGPKKRYESPLSPSWETDHRGPLLKFALACKRPNPRTLLRRDGQVLLPRYGLRSSPRSHLPRLAAPRRSRPLPAAPTQELTALHPAHTAHVGYTGVGRTQPCPCRTRPRNTPPHQSSRTAQLRVRVQSSWTWMCRSSCRMGLFGERG
jgi:hypothetical protein